MITASYARSACPRFSLLPTNSQRLLSLSLSHSSFPYFASLSPVNPLLGGLASLSFGLPHSFSLLSFVRYRFGTIPLTASFLRWVQCHSASPRRAFLHISTMRIHLWTTWVLLGAMFSIVAAQDATPRFQFDGTTFKGDLIDGHQSSVFKYENIMNGTTFKWLQDKSQDGAEVVRVDLMNIRNESILFWCPGYPNCTTTEGFDGSSLHA